MTARDIFRDEAEKVGATEALIGRAFAYADSTIPKSERQFVEKELSPEVAESVREIIGDYLAVMLLMTRAGLYNPDQELKEAIERN